MANVCDAFFEILTKFSHPPVLGLIFVIGFVFINRKAFGVTIFLTIFTMALNAYLKSIWQVPLNPELKVEGWAFPSGHTQSSCVFWFFLSLMLKKNWVILLIPILLFGITAGIVHFGYHEWHEILAAIGFAGLEVIFFYYLLKLFDYYKINYYTLGFALTPIVIFIITILPSSMVHNYYWLWYCVAAMLGVSLGSILFDKSYHSYKVENKLVTLAMLLLAAGVIYLVGLAIRPSVISNSVKLFVAGILISLVIPILDKKMSNINYRN